MSGYVEFAVTQSVPTGLISGTGAAGGVLTPSNRLSPNRKHRVALLHGLGNAVVLILLLVSFLLRLTEVAGADLPWGLVLTALSTAILGYTGWLGGELSYKHTFGVNPHQAFHDSPLLGSNRRRRNG